MFLLFLFHLIFKWFRENFDKWTPDTKLPVISLYLSEKGPKIQIPISSLIDWESKKLHIYQTQPILYYYAHTIMSAYPRIELGTRVLHQLYTVFDMNNMKIGFIQKQQIPNDSINDGCAESQKNKCKGSQSYYPPMNECLDPVCPTYLLHRVDDDKNCVLVSVKCKFNAYKVAQRIEFYIVYGIILFLFALAEFLIYEIYNKLQRYLHSR